MDYCKGALATAKTDKQYSISPLQMALGFYSTPWWMEGNEEQQRLGSGLRQSITREPQTKKVPSLAVLYLYTSYFFLQISFL